MISRKTTIVFAIIGSILLIDQLIKLYIKTHFALGEFVLPFGGEWCQIHFVENPGMAFGLQLGGTFGKLLLSVFRLVAVGFLGYYLYTLLRQNAHFGFICCVACVWAGAFGNIIDSAFYGLLFSESGIHAPALWLPSGGGYAGFLQGKVVDMFYFPLWHGVLPTWLPIWGGTEAEFFRPVFNFADASISVGVFFIIALQTTFFNADVQLETADKDEDILLETETDEAAEPTANNKNDENKENKENKENAPKTDLANLQD